MLKQIRTFLEKNDIHYDLLECSTWDGHGSINELSSLTNIPEKQFVKTMVVKLDGKWGMLVEPLAFETNLERWKMLLNVSEIELATESELNELFSQFDGVDKKALPALGNLFDMNVYLDDALSHEKEIAFNSGATTEILKMSYKDYLKFVKPKLVHLH